MFVCLCLYAGWGWWILQGIKDGKGTVSDAAGDAERESESDAESEADSDVDTDIGRSSDRGSESDSSSSSSSASSGSDEAPSDDEANRWATAGAHSPARRLRTISMRCEVFWGAKPFFLLPHLLEIIGVMKPIKTVRSYCWGYLQVSIWGYLFWKLWCHETCKWGSKPEKKLLLRSWNLTFLMTSTIFWGSIFWGRET